MNTPATCPRCGTALPPGSQTCPNCGLPLAAAGAAGSVPPAAYSPTGPAGGYAAQTGAPPPGYNPPPPGYNPPPPGYNPPPPGYNPPPPGYGQAPPQGYNPPPPGYGQAPPPGYGPPPAAPRGRPRWLLWVLGLVVLLIVGCAVFFISIFSVVNGALGPVTTAGDSFMGALRDGNYSQAFDLCTPDLQRAVVDVAGLQAKIEQNKKQPKSWNFNSRNQNNSQASFTGTATYADGSNGNVSLNFIQAGNVWKVDGFDFK